MSRAVAMCVTCALCSVFLKLQHNCRGRVATQALSIANVGVDLRWTPLTPLSSGHPYLHSMRQCMSTLHSMRQCMSMFPPGRAPVHEYIIYTACASA